MITLMHTAAKFQSMARNDYPKAASAQAQRALDHREKNGTNCGTPTGWARANQLAKKEKLSDSTIVRVYSFLKRHAQNNTGKFTKENGEEVCGSIMYAAWGGEPMLRWATKTIKEMQENERAKAGEIDGVPVYTTKDEAKAQAEKMGCTGVHEHNTDDGQTVFMPCATHDDASDGGAYARSAARVVEHRDHKMQVELREAENGGTTVVGYAAVFDQITRIGTFREKIARSAFDRVLTESPNVVALINHDNNLVLGRTEAGTLRLSTDDHGLRYELDLGAQSYAKDLAISLQRGDISKSSFAFTIERETWEDDVRTVNEVRMLYDISAVTTPAYEQSSAALRSECGCGECGCGESKKESTTLVAAKPAKKKMRNLQRKSFNMKNSDQLKNLRSNKLTELNALVQAAQAEEREYTDAEVQRQEQLNSDIATIDEQIKRAEATEANVQRFAQMGNATPKKETLERSNMNAKYDLAKALRQAAQGRLDGVENEMHQEALREASTSGIQLRGNVCIPQSFIEQRNVYGVDSGQTGVNDAVTTVATETAPLVEALRPNPIIAELGATQLNGFVGDIKLPTLPSDAASTPVEGAAATAFAGAMGGATLSPQRFAAEITLTKEALNQTTGNMSDVIARDFGVAIGNKIDEWAFAQLIGTTAALSGGVVTPTGTAFDGDATIVKASETGTNDLAATDAADVMRLWSTIAANGIAGNGSFVMRPALAGHLMAEPLSGAGSVPVMANGQISGYNARFSQNLPQINLENLHASAILSGGADVAFGDKDAEVLLFGDFSQLFWATWGGLSLTIDPFSGASSGTVKVVADQYFDAKLRHAGAVGVMVAGVANILGADA